MYSKINNPRLREYKKTYDKIFDELLSPIETNPFDEALCKSIEETLYDDLIEKCVPNFKNDRWKIKDMVFHMYQSVKEKRFTNFFIEDDVLKILENIPVKGGLNFSTFIKDSYTEAKSEHVEYSRNKLTGFVYTTNDDRAILFQFTESSSNLGIGLVWDDGEEMDMAGPKIIDGEVMAGSIYSEKGLRIMRIIINLFYYLNAYPDSVISKPPDEVKDKLNKDNSIRITVSEEMTPYLQRDMMPHLRRGHFRYLGSDYYKKKKGQTIFIHPIFVGGEAKTVINSDRVIQ